MSVLNLVTFLVLGCFLDPGNLLFLLHGFPGRLHGRLRFPAVALRRGSHDQNQVNNTIKLCCDVSWRTFIVKGAHSVFSQIVSDHTVLPHLLGCLRSLWKLWRLHTVSSVFGLSGWCPCLWLRLPTALLRSQRVQTQTVSVVRLGCGATEQRRKNTSRTFDDGDLALCGLGAMPAFNLAPPIFSSDRTLSLSSSGRLWNTKSCQKTLRLSWLLMVKVSPPPGSAAGPRHTASFSIKTRRS